MTYLYRAFDAVGDLLYVGITEDLEKRFRFGHTRFGHSGTAWRCKMTALLVEQYATRPEASAAEVGAIRTENPIYNVRGSKGRDNAAQLIWECTEEILRSPREMTPEVWAEIDAEDLRVRRLVRDALRSAVSVRTIQPAGVTS